MEMLKDEERALALRNVTQAQGGIGEPDAFRQP
jgi:hypothetical protein